MKHLLTSTIIFFSSLPAFSAPISPGTLVGAYKVEAKAGLQRVYLNFKVLNTREFELQRTYASGSSDEVCNGTYTLNAALFWADSLLAQGKTLKGVFTCPSNRSRNIDFNIEFENKTTEDLVKGTNVVISSSLAPGYRIKAYVKKQ